MSDIKWPTDVGESMLDVIHAASVNDSVHSAWAELIQYVIDKTTWRSHELNCQATVNFTATVKVPPGTDFDDDFVISEIVQQMDIFLFGAPLFQANYSLISLRILNLQEINPFL